MRAPTAYWDYIKVEELLSLQGGLAENDASLENEEVLFIAVHQIDELWFKLILRELVTVRNIFAAKTVPEQSLSKAVRGIRRMETLLQHTASHFAVLETMTTRDYLGFRDKLSPASGFQSAGLREIEVLAGLSEEERVPLGAQKSYFDALRNAGGGASPAMKRVEARLKDKPSLREAVEQWLYRTPIYGSIPSSPNDDATVLRFVENYSAAHKVAGEESIALASTSETTEADRTRLLERFQKEREVAKTFLMAGDVSEESRSRVRRIRAAALFLESYRELPLLAWPREVIDALVSFEQAFVLFRQRHARMVERIIGRRSGTGGSAGVDYLDDTARKYRIFRELWAVRTLLVREGLLPVVEQRDFYDFRSGDSDPPKKP